MTDIPRLAAVSVATECPDGGRFVSAAEADQIIKKRISVRGARKEFYEVTEKYTSAIPPIRDYAGLKKKLEKVALPEQAKVQLINLAPTSKQEISECIPGGDALNDEAVNEIIKIIREELESAKHIDDELMEVDSDIENDI